MLQDNAGAIGVPDSRNGKPMKSDLGLIGISRA